MISRFDQPVAIRSRFIPKQFTPNFNAYQQLLSQEQKNINDVRALQDIPIDALQGADEQYAQELRKQLSQQIDDITETYGTNIDDARRASRQFMRDTKRRTLPGGDIRELAARKKAFTDYQSEQSKRLQEGKITPEQYWASVSKAKQDYDASGGYRNQANLNLNARTEAVDFNEFANDFLKNFEANSGESMGLKYEPNTGKMYFDKTKITELQAQKIQQDLTRAFYNQASQTGQLDDLYSYRNKDGSMVQDNRAAYQQVLNDVSGLNLDNPEQAKQAQQMLNQLGFGLQEDGVAGTNTMNAIDQLEQYSNLTDDELNNQTKTKFLNDYINDLARPYSDAGSFRRVERDVQILGRTLNAEFDLAKRKKQLEVPFMFDGQSITMNYGSLAENGIKDLNQTVSAQTHRIKELQLAKEKALNSGDANAMQEAGYIESKIKWEEGRLQQLNTIRTNAYMEVRDKYDPETLALIEEINNNTQVSIAQGSGLGSNQIVQRELRKLADANNIPYEKVKEAYEVSLVIDEQASNLLESQLEQDSQISFNTLGNLPDNVTSAIEDQLQTMAFDFYDENGPVMNQNERGWFSEKEGTKPITPGKVKVRGVTKSAWGNTGHLFTLENTETGQIFYAAPRNSSLSRRLGVELDQLANGDPELEKIAFNLQHTNNISSQTAELRNGIPGVVTVGNNNELNIPIIKQETVYGNKYTLTVPEGMEGEGTTYSTHNNEELNDLIYIISTHGQNN